MTGDTLSGPVSSTSSSKAKPQTEEEIVEGFNRLRYEQRSIGSKINDLELDQREHNMVIKVLQSVEPTRKCMRMIDNVLIERQVKDILPALEASVQKMSECIETLSKQFEEKGRELQRYKAEHKIRIAGEKESTGSEKKDNVSSSTSGVLVS
ncbi:Prefoldin subunit 2 [Schistosoma japonicum]|uniref:Prefoldin subunit 2 n=1 Tax=Schistosoma japonicum TaxID=6182 RepID=Q5DHC5_SCHJA|nr:SJCHGC04348 protein [Schistosoma japonicum]KAH8876927.1 Prefoldin subunit 2 [Schistosoma japonicum]TNN18810.1 Prefoldin subunit 2 [Schistosoma japonicum]CAX75835.1 putative Prefoldin subunit 2 [Schistosoma japonicum]CAX75837.1 putative Prefoldin subunit 2 [Schistosoma japonicum]